VIQGILSSLCLGLVVQVCYLSEEDLKLNTDDSLVSLSEWPIEIHQLLSSFTKIFATKVTFPPPPPKIMFPLYSIDTKS
jgi:hypothetical protein